MKPTSDKKTNVLNARLTWLVKWAVALTAFVYILTDVYSRVKLNDAATLFKAFFSNKELLWYGPLVLLLIIINWSLEVLKWRWMMQKIEQISFPRAFRAVFTGLTLSFFTPNRVGEYAGRVLFLTKADRIKGIFITIVSSFSQLMITIISGLFCLIFYMKRIFADDNPIVYYIFISLVLLLILLLVLFYFNIHVVDWLCRKWHLSRKISHYTKVFQYYNTTELAKIVCLSALRYLTFSFQFYIVLRLFNVDVPLLGAFQMSALTYLTIAVVPTFALTEIGVRGSAALYFFGTLSSNSLGILTASLAVWITNIALPSAIGALCILYIKVRK